MSEILLGRVISDLEKIKASYDKPVYITSIEGDCNYVSLALNNRDKWVMTRSSLAKLVDHNFISPKQRLYILGMIEELGIELNINIDSLTRNEAAILITELKNKLEKAKNTLKE